MADKRLTEKQKQFIDYYIETGNATEAARLSGYKQPHVQGAQNLEKLRDCIDKKLALKDAKRIASQDEVLQYFTSVMRGEIKEKSVVGGVEVLEDPAIRDRNKAAEMLGKRYGLFDRAAATIIDDRGPDNLFEAISEAVNNHEV